MNKVIITIDTEGHKGQDPIKHLIWGKTANGFFGIDRIMDICDEYHIKALFFVDIAAAWDYGEESIKKVLQHIKNRGHDVGVHIHPDHMADKNRLFLWEYDDKEQYNIIQKCTELYESMMGERPLAFRAGKYGANRETLNIINDLGYQYDFSQFYGQKWCGINPPVAYLLPKMYKKVLEVPVTIIESLHIGCYKRYDKIDAVMPSNMYRCAMDCLAKKHSNMVVSLFFHSFSLLDWSQTPDTPIFNKKAEEKFIKTIKYVIDSPEYSFIELNQLQNLSNNISINEKMEDIPCVGNICQQIIFIYEIAFQIYKRNKKARILLYSTLAFCIILIWMLIILL